MIWQSLVRNWLQQQARQRVMQTVADAARGGAMPGGPGSSNAEPGAEVRAAPCDVGLVFALAAESGGLEDLLSGVITTKGADFVARQGVLRGRSIVIVLSGVGSLCAVRGAQALLAGHRPKWVISAGFAGALDPSLKRGDMFMATSLVHAGSRELNVDFKISPEVLASTPGLRVGRLLTVDALVGQAEDKRRLGQEHQAQAVDMESWNVGEVCRQAKTRFLSVRVISDAVDDVLPPEVEMLARQKTTAARLGAAAGAIFRRPSSLKDMLKLKEEALLASDRLAKFLAGVIPQLAPLPAAEAPQPG